MARWTGSGPWFTTWNRAIRSKQITVLREAIPARFVRSPRLEKEIMTMMITNENRLLNNPGCSVLEIRVEFRGF